MTVFGAAIGGISGWLVSAAILRDSFESLGPILEQVILIGISLFILFVCATSAWSIGRLIEWRSASIPQTARQTADSPQPR